MSSTLSNKVSAAEEGNGQNPQAIPEDSQTTFPPLPLPTYQFWYDILQSDDVDGFHKVIEESIPFEQQRMLNANFEYSTDDITDLFGDVDDTLTLPMAVASAHGSVRVIELMVEKGVDILAMESNGNKLIHTLVHLCVNDRKNITNVVKTYRKLCTMVQLPVLKDLLMAEDKEGLRPIELAGKTGAMEMIRVIFDTPGVYLTINETRGVITYHSYDVTDYEGTGSERFDKSPLAFASVMEEEWVSRHQTPKLMSWQPIQQWYRAKLWSNTPIIVIWFLVRAVHFIALLLYDMGVSRTKVEKKISNFNLTEADYCPAFTLYKPNNSSGHEVLKWYVVGHAIVVLLFDIVEAIGIIVSKRPTFLRYLVQRKEAVVHYLYYRVVQTFLAICIIVIVYISNVSTKYGHMIVDYVRLLAVLAASWSLLFLVQLAPSIGYFVVTIQRMLSDLLHFFFVYAIFILPFAHLFQMFMNENTKQGCIDYFKDPGVGIYSTFTMMLNMIDLRGYDIAEEKAAALYILHFTYVFIIAVLLVNFLIAIMSNSIAKVAENTETVMIVQRLSVVYLVEYRCRWLLRWYYKAMRSFFLHSKDEGIYLLSKEVKCSTIKPIEELIAMSN